MKEVRGVIPDTGFSHISVARKRVTKRTRCEHGQTGAYHTTHHKHLSTGIVSAVIPYKGAFSERFELVEEVVVLARVVEVGYMTTVEVLATVVVHISCQNYNGGSGTWRFVQ